MMTTTTWFPPLLALLAVTLLHEAAAVAAMDARMTTTPTTSLLAVSDANPRLVRSSRISDLAVLLALSLDVIEAAHADLEATIEAVAETASTTAATTHARSGSRPQRPPLSQALRRRFEAEKNPVLGLVRKVSALLPLRSVLLA